MNEDKAKNRLERRFEQLRAQSRAALVTFVTAGDPDQETSYRIFSGLAAAGADIIELGMPFSDPMADGPTIQTASQRALAAGMTLQKTLEQVGRYRRQDDDTPIILMGYYNPIHHFGVEAFLDAATEAGVDGLIIVDLPVEEDDELCHPAMTRGIHWIRLTTPTTDEQRLPRVLTHTSGFVYYVSVLGVTGTRSAGDQEIECALARLRAHTDLPVAVGFGIRTAEQVAKIGAIADAVVVGSAVVGQIADNLDEDGRATDALVDQVTGFVSELASGLRRD